MERQNKCFKKPGAHENIRWFKLLIRWNYCSIHRFVSDYCHYWVAWPSLTPRTGLCCPENEESQEKQEQEAEWLLRAFSGASLSLGLPWAPGAHGKFAGAAVGMRGQAPFDCSLSIFGAASWLRAVEAWRLGSMLCFNCVRTRVLRGAVWSAVLGGGWGARVLNACILGASGMWDFWPACLVECVWDYLLVRHQTSDSSPYECLADYCTCYFPSGVWTRGSFLPLIMSRST